MVVALTAKIRVRFVFIADRVCASHAKFVVRVCTSASMNDHAKGGTPLSLNRTTISELGTKLRLPQQRSRIPARRWLRNISPAWLPQIVGLSRVALEGQLDFATGPRRLVRSEDGFEHVAAILPGDLRLFLVLNAVHEVRHLLREAVVPLLLVDGERPTLG